MSHLISVLPPPSRLNLQHAFAHGAAFRFRSAFLCSLAQSGAGLPGSCGQPEPERGGEVGASMGRALGDECTADAEAVPLADFAATTSVTC